MTDRAHVLDALGTVYDPELDEPITSLRFVTSCDVTADGDVDVRLRLPTPQCAPNFAFLMAADARDAVRRLPEVGEVTVVLEDHYTGDEINARRRPRRGVRRTPSPARPRVSSTRCASCSTARRSSRASRGCCEALLAGGATPEEVTARRVADLPREPGARRCLELREHLGIAGRRRRAGVRPARRRADRGRRADPLAADGEARADEPRGQRRHLPLAAARPVRHPRPRGGGGDERGPAARVPPGAQARLRSTSPRRPGRSTSS